MKKYLILFVLFSIKVAISQEMSLDLPVLSPQTPNAFEFTKYGEIQVNESTGVISPAIPLFNYKAGPIDIPIMLQYSGNGVKVNQEPTWAGMNWNVSPGGIITRQVRDLVDEKTIFNNKKYISSTDLHNLQGEGNPDGTNSEWAAYLIDVADKDYIDSEVDIFNYNFLGYSGSFFLDENLNAHLINYDKEVRIVFEYMADNQSKITITTPNGDVYFFGYNKSDASRSFNNSVPGSYGLAIEAQNAFYLYQISPINGGQIDFDYSNMVTGTYTYQKTGKQESYSVSQVIFDGCATGGSTLPTGGSIIKNLLYTSYSSAVYLTKITSTFNSQEVEFNSTRIGNSAISSHHRRKLNSIVLKDNNGSIINKYDLNYETVETEAEDYENRFFLAGIDLYGQGDTNPQQYLFTYNYKEGLPSKDSYDQDHFGYFNNAGNTTLLPRLENYLVIKDNQSLANREANPLFATRGALTKIQFPTGGTSEFEYELRTVGEEYKQTSNHMYVYFNEAPYPDLLTDIAPDPAVNDLGFINNEYTDIKVHISATVEGDLTHHNFIEVIAEELESPYQQIIKQISIENVENTTKNYNRDIVFENLAPGRYIFKLNLNLYSPDDTKINAHADLSLASSELVTIHGSGIRIKKIITKESESATPIIKRYYYNNKENYLEETNTIIVMEPQYIYESVNRIICGHLYTDTKYTHLTANSLNNVFGSDAGKILYPYVTISYGGDNFENGGKELEFKVTKEGAPLLEYGNQIYSNYGTNRSHANSKLKNEIIFTKNNDSFTLLKETINKYQTDYSKVSTIHNIMTSKYYNTDVFSGRLEPFNIGLYETTSYWDYLESTEIRDYRESQNDTIIAKTEYEYTSGLAGLPSKIIVNNSEGTTNSQNLFYPDDAFSMTDILSTEQNMISSMVNNHRIGELVRVESLENDVKLSTTQKLYENFDGLVLPKAIQFAKTDNTLEDRITYLDYNFYGNPTLISMKDGTKTKYIYNTLQQVTQKIDNYDGVVDDNASGSCYYQDFYPNAMVTTYEYDSNTNALISVTDPRCNITTYHYDDFNRLAFIKDSEGKIIIKNEYHYKNQ